MVRGATGWGPLRPAGAFAEENLGAKRFFTGAAEYFSSQYYAKEQIKKHARYAFLDESVLNYTGNTEPIVGHASSNMNVTISGSLSFDHHHDYQGTGQYGASGTLTRYANFYAQPYATAGTITSMMEFHAADPSGAGTISTLYGFYCPNLTKGSSRYAFYAGGTTPNYFGGAITTAALFTVSWAAAGGATASFQNTTAASYCFVGLDGGAAGGGQFQFSANGTPRGGVYGDSTGLTVYNNTSTVVALTISTTLAAFKQTTEATSVSAAAVTTDGGLGVAKRSYLGTIGSSFKGNVIAGVQDATADTAGALGETLVSTVAGVAAGSSGAASNVTSLAVTRGKWRLSGFNVVSGGATGLTSGSTVKLSIVSTSATNGTSGATMTQESVLALLANGLFEQAIPDVIVNISADTTYYLTSELTYVAGSPTHAATFTAERIR